MFADVALAARIDRAEARLCAHFAEGAATPDALVLPISGGQAIFVSPSSPINKLIGLGFDTDLDLDALARIEAEWRRRGEPVRIELSVLTDPAIGGVLTDRGYKLHGFENVLGRALDDEGQVPPPSSITIDVVQGDDARVWVDVAVEAFLDLDGTGSGPDDAFTREQLQRSLEELAGVAGFIRYLARIDGEVVGEAGMRIDGEIAQVAGAGTLPRFRGRGVQKALLHRRLKDAREAGCRLAVVTTAPGTRSQDNVMRRGFALLYTRAILIRPST
jgi:GNAT superfamily N-acetyltransferase